MLTYLIIPLVFVTIGYAIAFSRKGSVAKTTLASRILDVHAPVDPETAFRRIQGMGGLYKVDDADPQQRILVLSSSVTMFSWGFLYPVVITAGAGGSTIRVGIQSKLVQWGPIVTRAHRDVVARIERAVGAASVDRVA